MTLHNNASASTSRRSTSRRLTPTSSASPSPRHLPVSLPPSTSQMSLASRRASVDSTASSRASIHASIHRRPSVSVNSVPSSSPGDRNVSSLRHVGEGVLDDSDSSSSGTDGDEEGSETAGAKSSDPEISFRPLHSPLLTSLRMMPVPSPLSRVASHHAWTEDELDGGCKDEDEDEDEDEGSSPSPQSTDTDSDGSTSPSKARRLSRSSRRSSGHKKSRSRSSTVASLLAPPRPLIHRDSRGSIRTVTAGEAPFNGLEGSNGFQPDNNSPRQRSIIGHGRQRSQAISELVHHGAKSAAMVDHDERNSSLDNCLSERRIESITDEEARFKETTLCALREALEVFAEEVCLPQLVDLFIFCSADISVVG